MARGNVYSVRFLGWSASSTPPPYTVPEGYVAIVRDVDVTSGGGAMTNFALVINTVAVIWRGQFTVESVGQSAQWRGRQVLNPGDILDFASDVATDGAVSGYLLTQDAP